MGVEPADQVGAAALIVAAGDAGYKPFHKKVGTFMDVLHSLVKTILAEKEEFEGAVRPPTHPPTHPPIHVKEEEEAARMRCCVSSLGGWVGRYAPFCIGRKVGTSNSSFRPPRPLPPSQPPTHPPAHPPLQDLAKVFVGLTKLSYEGSPKQLIRDLVREVTARITAGELSGAQVGFLPTHPPTHPPIYKVQQLIQTASFSTTHPPTHPPRLRLFSMPPPPTGSHLKTRFSQRWLLSSPLPMSQTR